MRKHKFLNRHSVLGYILVSALFAWLLFYGIANLIGAILYSSGVDTYPAMTIGYIIAAFPAVALHQLFFKGEFNGFFGCPGKKGSLLTGLKAGWVMAAYWIVLIVLALVFGKFDGPSLDGLWLALFAGIGEEFQFRIFGLAYIARQSKTNRGIVIGMVATALIFGLYHLINLAAGAAVPITLMQVYGASCMGLVLAYAYLKSGSILPIIILHGMTDFVGFMDSAQIQDGLQVATSLTLANYIDIAACTLMVVYVIFRLTRAGELDGIRETWALKWNKAAAAE